MQSERHAILHRTSRAAVLVSCVRVRVARTHGLASRFGTRVAHGAEDTEDVRMLTACSRSDNWRDGE